MPQLSNSQQENTPRRIVIVSPFDKEAFFREKDREMMTPKLSENKPDKAVVGVVRFPDVRTAMKQELT